MSDIAGDSVRVGSQDRDEATALLARHHTDGRLSDIEYEARVGRAANATTVRDIRQMFADLPGPHPSCLLQAAAPAPMVPAYTYAPPVVAGQSDKSKVVAGVLQIVLPFGIGRFYAGNVGMGVAMLLVTIFTFGIGAIWSFIDGIILLTNGGVDGQGRPLSG